jgi:alpha-N-arabinofuranosidase
MPSAKLILDAAFTIAPVPRRIFGSFVEHMGRVSTPASTNPDTRRLTTTACAATCWR